MKEGVFMNILVIGGSSFDTILKLHDFNVTADDQSFFADDKYSTVGGTGAGKSFCLKALGYDHKFISLLGNDQESQYVLDEFNKRQLDYEICYADKTIQHTNIMYKDGNRMSIFTDYPSSEKIDYLNLETHAKSADVIFLNIDSFCKNYFKLIERSSAKVIVDLHDYKEGNDYYNDFIKLADIIVASSVNLPNEVAFLESMIDKGKECAILTKGSKGLIAIDSNKKIIELDAFPISNYVDSNGAGDSFVAGFTIKYLETNDFLESLKFGSHCGKISCTSKHLFPYKINKIDFETK